MLEQFASGLEKSSTLDALGRATQSLVRRILPAPVADVLRGAPIGHPLHPALVAVPIGSWVSASLLDLTGGDAAAARRLVGFGVLAAVPSAVAGAADWAQIDAATETEAFRVAYVHALLNDLALTLYATSWLARRKDRRVKGALAAFAGSGALTAAGWLGGHIVFRRAVGVTPV